MAMEMNKQELVKKIFDDLEVAQGLMDIVQMNFNKDISYKYTLSGLEQSLIETLNDIKKLKEL